MATNTPTSAELIEGLVRRFFDVEPGAVTALAHGDEPTTDPMEGLAVFMRHTVTLALAMRDHPGPVALVTERQASAAGWPSATLANRSIVLAWALFISAGPGSASPLLLEADEEGREFMGALIRLGPELPDYRDLLSLVLQDRRIDHDAMERVAAARENAPPVANVRYVSLALLLDDWFGVDAASIDLESNIFGERMEGLNARAVIGCKWLITTALDLGRTMRLDAIEAVRIKTEDDALLADEPGAALANGALLLGVAVAHDRGRFLRMLPPRDDLAMAVVEAGHRARERRLREQDSEMDHVELLGLMDIAARGYVHVGRAKVREVAWRQIRGET